MAREKRNKSFGEERERENERVRNEEGRVFVFVCFWVCALSRVCYVREKEGT